uniref:TIR domain-containing protein n=1 Tax=Steinernema glaseri TaxID=37863 RepID=A0A1I7ZTB9_9BILA
MADYIASVEDGVEHSGVLRYWSSKQELHKPEEMEAVPKKSVSVVLINLLDGKQENICREIVKRYPYSSYQFVLYSSSIDKAWVEFACSLKRLDTVMIRKKLEDDSIPLFQKLVDGRKLSWLPINEEACEGGIEEILKSLFCQDQFKHLQIRNDLEGPWKSTTVRDLLQFWSENGEKLRGARLTVSGNCGDGVDQLEQFVLHRAAINTRGGTSEIKTRNVLTLCSKEECDFINKYYQHHNFRFITPSCVYKFEEGKGDDQRKLYISFSCAHGKNRANGRYGSGSREGVNDLSLMRGTKLLHVVFG